MSPPLSRCVLTTFAWLLLATSRLLSFTASVAADDKSRALNQLSAAEIAAGWVRLFDGETFFGWKPNNDVNWQITDGVIHADQGEPGLLVTTAEFSDFELLCDFRLSAGGNSGVFLRSIFAPKDPVTECYELNICDSHPNFPTGSLVGLVKPNQFCSGERAWHTYRVKAVGDRIEVALDGKPILDWRDTRPAARRRGLIGLQKNAGRAEYRNVLLRPLATTPLFNGKDLAGWRVGPGSSSQFAVADGTIHATGGPGFLESLATWGDFLLQAEIRTNGNALNSGIFFRALPVAGPGPAQGYEAQVHNAWRGDDRTQPVDFGTGAIYRRVPARRVVSNDFEWFTMTVAASGPHVSVWVDGEQVTDWTDTRSPSDNPREGLRLAPGHIALQGHDPTTDLSFRNLRIVEPPAATSESAK
ncbi:MAG: 3-keto-disaccharide hydrolase [Planctomycetaceae bacterium]